MGERPSIPFIALMAFLMSTAAFSIDAMLTSFPQIAAELSPHAPSRAELVIGTFILGSGIGTFFIGPLADRFGRRPVILAGMVLFVLGAVIAAIATSLEMLLLGRFVQGVATSAPRVAVMAIIRDRFEGRVMAATVSLVTMVFSLVPGIAPAMGDIMSDTFGWRAVFLAFIGFGVIGGGWFFAQQPETLPPEFQRPLNPRQLWQNTKDVLSNRTARAPMLIQGLIFGGLLSILAASPRIFDQVYGYGDIFPYVMGAISLVSASTSFTNSRIVERIGMVPIIRFAIFAQMIASIFALYLYNSNLLPETEFWVFLTWKTVAFLALGFSIGNLMAIALQPFGHIAGTAASVLASVSTIMAAVISIVIGQFVQGNPSVLVASVLFLVVINQVLSSDLREEKTATA